MTWSDITFEPTPKALRQFAGGWLVVFLAFGAHQYWRLAHHQAGLVLGLIAIVVGVPGLIRPAVLRWLFVAAMVLAFPMGWLISQLMLSLMFYGIVTPIALFFRIRGRDLLSRKPAPNKPTFWTPKQTPQDVRSYFRQF